MIRKYKNNEISMKVYVENVDHYFEDFDENNNNNIEVI